MDDSGFKFPKSKKKPKSARKNSRRKGMPPTIKKGQCLACHKTSDLDWDHVRSKGAGGSNRESNLWQICRTCHQRRHYVGLNRFVEENPHLEAVLLDKGFTWDEFIKRWGNWGGEK